MHRKMDQCGRRQGGPRQGSSRSFRRPPAQRLRHRRHRSCQLLHGRARAGTGCEAGWRMANPPRKPLLTDIWASYRRSGGNQRSPISVPSGCVVASRPGGSAASSSDVPSRLTQPHDELDLLLRNVPESRRGSSPPQPQKPTRAIKRCRASFPLARPFEEGSLGHDLSTNRELWDDRRHA